MTQTGTASCTKTVLNGTTATPTVRLSACSGDGAVTITLASAAGDAAGNADAGAGPSTSVTVDNTAPTVAIGSPSSSTVNFAATTEFGITYSGAASVILGPGSVTVTSTGDVYCKRGVVNGTTATPTVRLSECSGDGTVTISLPSASTDAAGNADAGAGPSSLITVDNTAPTVSFTSTPAINNINKTGYVVSGICSENARTVSVSVGGTVNASPACSGGTFTTAGMDVSGLTDSASISVTADHIDTAGNNATQASTTVIKDTIDPAVSSVAVPANATYTTGQNLDFTVNWSENVSVTGTDSTMGLTIGTTSKTAAYLSKTATGITYRYTVQSGDNDADGIAVGSLTQNATTIRDAVSNDANLTFNSIGSTVAILVDAVLPVLTAPTTADIGANIATLTLKADSTGTGYFTVLTGSGMTCGSGTQVKNGQASTGAAAYRRGSLALTANTLSSYAVRNLTQSTDYTVCFTADDGANLQPTPATVDFTTPAAINLTTSAWTTVGSAGFSAREAEYTALAFAPDGTSYVAYMDWGNGTKATVKKYDGAEWVNVGNAGLSAGAAKDISLASAPDGTPFLAYRDYSNSDKAAVKKYDGAAWVNVGNAWFSAPSAYYTSLSFAPDGTPYVAYSGVGGTVKKYDGTSWTNVGSGGVADSADYTSLSFAPDGTPYVAYRDGGNDAKATVKKYDGIAWVNVGTAGFSAGIAEFTALSFAPDGTPYVAYMDWGNDAKARVKKYNGAEWVNVGNAGFSAGESRYISLSFAPDGTPYVAYSDAINGWNATVKKYDGAAWTDVGGAGFSAGQTGFTALSFAPDGIPYVAYMDRGNGDKATVMKLSPAYTVTYDGNGAGSGSVPTDSGIYLQEATVTAAANTGGLAWSGYTFVGWNTAADGSGTSHAASGSATFTMGAANVTLYALWRIDTTVTLVSVPGNATYIAGQNLDFTVNWSENVTLTGTASTLGLTIGGTARSAAYLTNTAAGITYRYTAQAGDIDTDGITVGALSLNGDTIRNSDHFNAILTLNSVGSTAGVLVASSSTAATSAASGITAPGATLNGTVSSNGASTTVTFDYGLTTSYSNTNVAATTGGTVAAGATAASVTVSGLTCNTTYHFRVSGTSSAGTTNGSDLTFTTSACSAAPTLTTPSFANVGAGSATLVLRADASGTGWFTLLAGSGTACGDATQTTEGKDSTGAAALRFGSLPLTASTDANYTIRNLTGGASYTVCFTAGNNGTLLSTPVTTNLTTTAAAATATNWKTVGSPGFSAGIAGFTSLAFAPDGVPYLAYEDWGNSGKATVMKYDGSNWVAVGSPGFSAGWVDYTSLAFAPDGVPYLAYQDEGNSNKATVMRFEGSNWVAVGSPGFSAGAAYKPSLAFAPDGAPYLAYEDDGNSNKATVMRYDGSNWVPVGGPGFSAGYAVFTSLAFAPDGAPYVAYRNSDNKATVMRFDGSNWVAVGSLGFSAGQADYTSLAFAPDGAPYLAYEDWGNSGKATVMKYDGSNWVAVGSPGFSAGWVDYTSLAFAPDGVPYLAYQDEGNSNKATVMRFEGSNWVAVGNPGFSAEYAVFTSLAFAPDGIPYVGYVDGVHNATVMRCLPRPTVTTGAASDITAVGAIMNGAANANGYPTAVIFEYGTSTAYGSSIAAPTIVIGTADEAVMAGLITGLTPGTVYHYRVKAVNEAGTAYGSDATFTTLVPPQITSGSSAAFTIGGPGSFTVTATGTPQPALTKTGALPAGVTFTDNGNGTATIGGTAASGTAGTYPLTITANGALPNATQTFTLTVNKAAATVTLGSLSQTYDGSAKAATAATTPAGKAVTFTYDGVSTAPTNAGSYAVVGTISDENYQGTASGTLVITDSIAPTFVLSTLANNTTTNNPVLNVAGTVNDSDSGLNIVTVNGVEVTVTAEGTFSTAIVLLEGVNVVTVVATDNTDNQSSETRTITFDTTAPGLTLTLPADNSFTAATVSAITGSIDDPNAVVTATVNGGSPLNATVDGTSFSIVVNLTSGLNTIDITVNDQAGNSTVVKRSITSDTDAPTLEITVPEIDTIVGAMPVTITGTVNDALTEVSLVLTVNDLGVAPTISGSTFIYELTTSQGGSYQIRAIATDLSGNSATVTRNIIYTPFGDADGNGTVEVADALKVLKMAVGLETPDPAKGDAAPLVGGKPQPDGKVNAADALVILRRAIGDVNW